MGPMPIKTSEDWEMNNDTGAWEELLIKSLASGKAMICDSGDLNKAIDHIHRLLMDASLLLEDGSFATCTFLAITALEETAKVHVGMYRNGSEDSRRSKDPLYSHRDKHRLAAAPAIPLGSRLGQAIGNARVDEFMEMARTGDLVKLREECLYLSSENARISAPLESIDLTLARDILLFCIEAFDDALVGYTNYSFEVSNKTDALFGTVSETQ